MFFFDSQEEQKKENTDSKHSPNNTLNMKQYIPKKYSSQDSEEKREKNSLLHYSTSGTTGALYTRHSPQIPKRMSPIAPSCVRESEREEKLV